MCTIRERAEMLAARRWLTARWQDQTTDGRLCWMAANPQLPGCKAQGWTEAEALDNLAEARVDYIESLLEDNLSVPAVW